MIAKQSMIWTRWESKYDSNEVCYVNVDELLDIGTPMDSHDAEMKTNGIAYLKKDDEYVPMNL